MHGAGLSILVAVRDVGFLVVCSPVNTGKRRPVHPTVSFNHSSSLCLKPVHSLSQQLCVACPSRAPGIKVVEKKAERADHTRTSGAPPCRGRRFHEGRTSCWRRQAGDLGGRALSAWPTAAIQELSQRAAFLFLQTLPEVGTLPDPWKRGKGYGHGLLELPPGAVLESFPVRVASHVASAAVSDLCS